MLWVKSFHIFFVISWFACLFYLPRLFVYHAMCEDEAGNARFKIMERKLFYGMMTPCMILTLVFGGWAFGYNAAYYLQAGWMHAKLTLVVVLLVYHGICWHHLKQFRDDCNTRSHKYYRVFNELPVFLLLAIIILVIVKPF